MTEQEIVAELAKKTTPESPQEQVEKPKEPETGDPDAFHNNDPIEGTLQQYQLMEYFDVPVGERHSAEVQQNISMILQWAKTENPGKDFADVLAYIRTSEGQFGNNFKEQRVFKLANHIKIQRSIKLLQEKERSMHG